MLSICNMVLMQSLDRVSVCFQGRLVLMDGIRSLEWWERVQITQPVWVQIWSFSTETTHEIWLKLKLHCFSQSWNHADTDYSSSFCADAKTGTKIWSTSSCDPWGIHQSVAAEIQSRMLHADNLSFWWLCIGRLQKVLHSVVILLCASVAGIERTCYKRQI